MNASPKTPPVPPEEPSLKEPWLTEDRSHLIPHRTETVLKYVLSYNPNTRTSSMWPDGIDWPNWNQPHELWFTGHEHEYLPRARALHIKMLREEELNAKAPAPRRTPFARPDDQPKPKSTQTPPLEEFDRLAAIVLQHAAEREAQSTVSAEATKMTGAPVTKPATETVTKPPVTETQIVTKPPSVTKPQGGRPARGDTPETPAERAKRYRAAKKALKDADPKSS